MRDAFRSPVSWMMRFRSAFAAGAVVGVMTAGAVASRAPTQAPTQLPSQTASQAPTPAPATATPPVATATVAPRVLDQVVFIGASATAGFGVIITDPDGKQRSAPLPLAAGFAGAVTGFPEDVTPRNFGSSLFFLSPGVTGAAQVDRALELKPTLIVALDFLFWYGYGNDDGKGGSLARESARLEKLELGFKQLERIDPSVPVIVGDFPNMAAAVGKMLSKEQMPEAASLEALNARLVEWAGTRPNVILFPLSDLVSKLKTGETIRIAGIDFEKAGGRLLQSDELHPTARGSIAMSLRIAELLNEKRGSGPAIETVKDEPTAQRRAHAAALRVLAKRGGATPAKSADPAKPVDPVKPTPPASSPTVPVTPPSVPAGGAPSGG
jgi:hypothetical protein